MFHPTRRSFLAGCAVAAASTGLPRVARADAVSDPDILVVVFLRGGMDGLNLLCPTSGDDRTRYENHRPTLAVPRTGEGAALDLGNGFGLHPAAQPLLDLFERGQVAVVHACGMDDPTRSHFEAQDFMELGTPGAKTTSTGWLHRHLASAANLPEEILVPALSAGFLQPMSLLGTTEALTLEGAEDFTFSTGPWLWREPQRLAMRRMHERHADTVGAAGLTTMNAVDVVSAYVSPDYEPAGSMAYPEDEIGRRFKLIAQMLTADVGTRVVTLDIGDWDTHENQGAGSGGQFAGLVGSLTTALAAFQDDMEAVGLADRITVVTMTEFGRRLDENADAGTDHGHAAPMILVGRNVRGGLHGQWPGLAPSQLFEGLDVEVTTDYRRVLSEVLIRRLGNPDLAAVFPGYTGYEPLGVVQGTDLSPITDSLSRNPSGRAGG
jgi:uncharacterized protein (DUF1501 family)